MNIKQLVIKESCFELNDSQLKKIDKILNRYFDDLLTSVNKSVINPLELNEYIMTIAEAFPLFEDKNKWLEISYIIMNDIKRELINPTINKSISLFGGLCDTGFATYLLNKNTGHYGKFLDSINKLIFNYIKQYLDYCNSNFNELTMQHYDIISGLAGMGYYMLLIHKNEQENELLHDVMRYLIKLSGKHLVEKEMIPNWHIKSRNQIRNDEKLKFPKGNFNFGLAHGIAGPMVTLSKAYSQGEILEGHGEAIESFIEEYKNYSITSQDGSIFWPTQLSFEDYIAGVANDELRPRIASWCYGNIGISRSLYVASKNIGDEKMMKFSFENIEKIALMNILDYNLESPILCHGYAGLLSILNLTYKETKNDNIKNGMYKIIDELLSLYVEESRFGFKNKETLYEDGKIVKRATENNSFMEGTSGIVLSLISIVKDKTDFENHLIIK
ncbi:lanthionine synthetase C family protein [Tissierella pigra]|uniref:Lanthionine synthetase C family protein n=1 Tax=Tissierella pigra TaxID=2607614 RepID=A0A6N7Y0M1_9FIRM|nr:lanthionine synthetase C family protein [Tissierella pigra]MSU02285.1 lanthionine synthetase C family protein [Tissierella pigra]